MKILLIVDDYLPGSIKIGAKMMHDLAIEFRARGHAVTVLTPESSDPSAVGISTEEGVTVCRFRTGPIKNTSKVIRAVNETLLPFRAWLKFRTHFLANPHDLIIYYSPTIFWGPLVMRLKSLWDATSYLVLRDFFPQWVIDNGMLREQSRITRYFRHIEKWNYEAADRIAVQSPGNLEVFRQMSSVNRPLEVLFNWGPEMELNRDCDYKAELGLSGKVIFFYGGNIGHAQDMMNIVRLANRMREYDEAHFVLIGDGDELGLVRESVERMELANLTLLPPVTQEKFADMLMSFDVGLVSLHRSHTAHNFPGKLLAYMNAGHPILGSVNPGNDLKQILESAQAGFISTNGNDEEFLANALTLLKQAKKRARMGRNSRQLLSSRFSIQSAANQIAGSVPAARKSYGAYRCRKKEQEE